MVNEGKKEATPNNMYNRIRGCWHQMPRSCPRTENWSAGQKWPTPLNLCRVDLPSFLEKRQYAPIFAACVGCERGRSIERTAMY